jgi:hypothetical protein
LARKKADPPDILAHRRYIEDALRFSNGTHEFSDVVEAVAAGTLQFWPGRSSAIVTEILQTPRKRILHFFLAGGNLAELETMLPSILEWGKLQGCDFATLVGRKGWERTFITRQGWQPKLVLFEAPI